MVRSGREELDKFHAGKPRGRGREPEVRGMVRSALDDICILEACEQLMKGTPSRLTHAMDDGWSTISGSSSSTAV